MNPYRVPAPRPPRTLYQRADSFLVRWQGGVTLVSIALAGALSLTLLAEEGCKEALPIINAVLTASQLACAFESTLTDANALADACAIDKALVPALENIIGEREAAAKTGVRWQATGDGGVGALRHVSPDGGAP